MSYAVLKGSSYTLAFTPSMVLHNGTTQTTEMVVNPNSEYLKELPNHLRSYEDVVNYLPNQVYIGNATDEALRNTAFPWYDKPVEGTREGKYGEIMPEDEFIGLIQICDVFDLVVLEKEFAANYVCDDKGTDLVFDGIAHAASCLRMNKSTKAWNKEIEKDYLNRK